MSRGKKLATFQRSMLPPSLGCHSLPLLGLLNLADGGNTLFRNVSNYIPVNKVRDDIPEDPSLRRFENFKSHQRATTIKFLMLFDIAEDVVAGCLLTSEEKALIGERPQCVIR